MNGYKCFYRNKTADIRAETTRAAQLKAAALWRVKPNKTYMISVYLCETADGAPVTHIAVD